MPGRVGSAPQGDHLLGTGRVAKILGTSVRSVANWIDSGRLPGFRLPGGQDRRVRACDLRKFLREYGYLVPPGVERALCPVLAAGCGPFAVPGHDVHCAADLCAACHLAALHPPAVAVICATGLGRADALRLGRHLKGLADAARLVALAAEDDALGEWPGFDAVLRHPHGDVGAAVAEMLGA